MKIWLLAFAFLLNSLNAAALEMNSECRLGANGQISGDHIDQMFPIASLSKLMVSHWMIAEKGADYRFQTKIHLTSTDDGLYDLHLEGGMDPYFSNDRLQLLVSYLNSLNIKSLRNLTYDDYFFYIHNLDYLASSDAKPTKQWRTRTQKDLATTIANLNKNLGRTQDRAKRHDKINILSNLTMTIQNISYLSREQFKATSMTKTFKIKSAPVVELLYNMNKFSNNHAAEYIFYALGGTEKYPNFAQKSLGLTGQDLKLINGSGGPEIQKNGTSLYNGASCRAVLTTLNALHEELKKSKLHLWDILATAGVESDTTNPSSVTKNYDSSLTRGSLVAKTGTVNQAVNLAGLISTDKETFLFAQLYGTRNNQEWIAARQAILQNLTLIFQKSTPKVVPAKDPLFLSFDRQSLVEF